MCASFPTFLWVTSRDRVLCEMEQLNHDKARNGGEVFVQLWRITCRRSVREYRIRKKTQIALGKTWRVLCLTLSCFFSRAEMPCRPDGRYLYTAGILFSTS